MTQEQDPVSIATTAYLAALELDRQAAARVRDLHEAAARAISQLKEALQLCATTAAHLRAAALSLERTHFETAAQHRRERKS